MKMTNKLDKWVIPRVVNLTLLNIDKSTYKTFLNMMNEDERDCYETNLCWEPFLNLFLLYRRQKVSLNALLRHFITLFSQVQKYVRDQSERRCVNDF